MTYDEDRHREIREMVERTIAGREYYSNHCDDEEAVVFYTVVHQFLPPNHVWHSTACMILHPTHRV